MENVMDPFPFLGFLQLLKHGVWSHKWYCTFPFSMLIFLKEIRKKSWLVSWAPFCHCTVRLCVASFKSASVTLEPRQAPIASQNPGLVFASLYPSSVVLFGIWVAHFSCSLLSTCLPCLEYRVHEKKGLDCVFTHDSLASWLVLSTQ